MKRIILGLLSGIIFLTACGQTQPFDTAQDRPTPAPLIQNATFTPSPLPTNTSTSIPTETPTASITPTLSEFIQSNPFPTESLNPTAQAIAQKWNLTSALLSPDGQWAALSDHGILHIVQTQGREELFVNCETFHVCEFIVPLQWSPDSTMLYFAPLLTGESSIPFRQYTGIARINISTGNIRPLAKVS